MLLQGLKFNDLEKQMVINSIHECLIFHSNKSTLLYWEVLLVMDQRTLQHKGLL